MFFVASCTLLPLSVLEAIRSGVSSADSGPSPIITSSPLLSFADDGFYCGMALLWLRERMRLDLLHSEYDDVARRVGSGRVCLVFTAAHRECFYDLIEPANYPLEELAGYVSASGDPEAGKGMQAALHWLKECLGKIAEDQAALLIIG